MWIISKQYNMFNWTELFMNISLPAEETGSDDIALYLEAGHVIRCILCTLIIFLNILVIVLTMRVKKMKTRMLFFVVNLAIADLTVGLLYVLPDAIEDNLSEWPLGVAGCNLKWFLSNTVMLSSTYMVVAMALDRLYIVAWPIHSATNGRRSAIVMVIIVWVMCTLMATPFLKITTATERNGLVVCHLDLQENSHLQLYVTIFFFLVVFIPGFVIASCYIGIVWIIWRKSVIRRFGKDKSSSSGNGPMIQSESRQTTSTLLPRAKAKSLLMTVVIVITYIVCWGPFFTYFMFQVYGVIEPRYEGILMQALAPLNSAANPVICIFFNYQLFCGHYFFGKGKEEKESMSELTTYTTDQL